MESKQSDLLHTNQTHVACQRFPNLSTRLRSLRQTQTFELTVLDLLASLPETITEVILLISTTGSDRKDIDAYLNSLLPSVESSCFLCGLIFTHHQGKLSIGNFEQAVSLVVYVLFDDLRRRTTQYGKRSRCGHSPRGGKDFAKDKPRKSKVVRSYPAVVEFF